jgi:hypothetical protein
LFELRFFTEIVADERRDEGIEGFVVGYAVAGRVGEADVAGGPCAH